MFGRTTSREPGAVTCVMLACCVLVGCGGPEPSPSDAPIPEAVQAEQPNFLFLLPDSMRADRVLLERDGEPLAPAVRSLAERGVLFEQATSVAGWTLPAVATLMTGRYPALPSPGGKTVGWMAPEHQSFPQILSLYGYRTTGFIGVNSEALLDTFGSRFDDLVVASGDEALPRGASAELSSWLRAAPEEPFLAFAHDVDLRFVATVQDLSRWPGVDHGCLKVRKDGSRDKELDIVALNACLETTISGDALGRDIGGAYDAAIAEYDRGLGHVLAALDETGLAERTVIVLTSPHGHHLGEDGRFCHGTLREPDLRIPMIWVEPSARGPGQRVERVVPLMDLAPTILLRAGATVDAGMKGQSLLPLLGIDAAEYEDRDIFHFNSLRNLALRSGDLKLVRLEHRGRRPGPDRGPVPYEFFDLRVDPDEQNDLMAGEPPPEAAALRVRLDAFEREIVEDSRAAMQGPGGRPNPELRNALQDHGYWHHVDPDAEGLPPGPPKR